MTDLVQVDVFAESPFTGNPLAVFPDAGELETAQMQAIAREMNLSETVFVLSVTQARYEVRIFTPEVELPFAGHPSLGAAWTLQSLQKLGPPPWTQLSPGGETPIWIEDDIVWLRRTGTVEGDLTGRDRIRPLAEALSMDADLIGLEARELGRSGRLEPAYSDAGLRLLMIPLRDPEALRACPPPAAMPGPDIGTYCFTAEGAGKILARGFFPGAGIPEDPATGAAAASLGLYLADRVGAIDFAIEQGAQVGRASLLHVQSRPGRVDVGGRCCKVLEGRLTELPPRGGPAPVTR